MHRRGDENTFCTVRGNRAVLSQHFGDLSDEGVEAQWRSALSTMQEIYAFQPERVVCDAHPGYHARQWARTQALPVETVLHHHAHAAACLAENGWPLDGGDVIALTLDGIGMGENGAVGRRVPAGELSRLRTAGRSASRCAAGAIWRQNSRGAICSPTVWRSYLTGSSTRKLRWYSVKTGRCWQRRCRAVSMRRGPPPVVVCSTPWPVRWALKRNAMRAKPRAGWRRWPNAVQG